MLDSCDLIALIPTTDLVRARAFYQDTLGLRVLSEDPFAAAFDGHGTMLRVTLVGEVAKAPYTVLGWSVADIAAAVADLAGRGVAFERFDGMTQDELGIWTAPGGDQVAWFKDPDGNTLSLTEHTSGD
jgi:catechol 2,3-dioxygenase-like lactoylglutathione lyase family enzyme